MCKALSYLFILSIFAACQPKQSSEAEQPPETPSDPTAMLADSLLYLRHSYRTSDILSRHLPTISRPQAISIQLAMLEKEVAAGARLVGWKMGGTITDDSATYDPLFGYILDHHLIAEDSIVQAENFPDEQVMIEGEIGFVMSEDFPAGAASLDELEEGIDYVVGAIEFAQSTAVASPGDSTPLPIDYVLASGMGQAGTMLGSKTLSIDEFDASSETVSCVINDEVVAEGRATRVYQGPLHALYSLANMLPEHDLYLRKGDVVITGSLYNNPTIDSTSQVRLEFSNLGTISFRMK